MSYEVKCEPCRKVYTKRSYYGSNICDECSNIRDKLIYNQMDDSSDIDVALVYDKYVIQITYSVNKQEHDGYCSDPYEDSESNYDEEEIYPLLKVFKETDINKNYTIDLSNPKLAYYKKPKQGHGNGYCNRATTWYITKAQVKNKIDLIKLD